MQALAIRYKSWHGYVMFITLIFLQLFALLTIQVVLSLSHDKKQARIQLQLFSERQQALTMLASLDNANKLECTGETHATADLQRYSLGWWQSHACHGKEGQWDFYYFHELLAEDGCAVINENKLPWAAVYVRNTLLVMINENFYQSVILQDTIAKAGQRQPYCDLRQRNIKPGRQMLRILR